MSALTNALVIGKLLSIAGNLITKEWKAPPPGKKAQRCPVCEGEGVYTTDHSSRQCHGCEGKGWVAV